MGKYTSYMLFKCILRPFISAWKALHLTCDSPSRTCNLTRDLPFANTLKSMTWTCFKWLETSLGPPLKYSSAITQQPQCEINKEPFGLPLKNTWTKKKCWQMWDCCRLPTVIAVPRFDLFYKMLSSIPSKCRNREEEKWNEGLWDCQQNFKVVRFT